MTMSNNLGFDATMHRLAGRSCAIAAARSEWVIERIAENLQGRSDFVRVEIETFDPDEEVAPDEVLTTIDRFDYWNEKSGLLVAEWPSWFLARLVRYARRSRHRILPGPRSRPFIVGPQQTHIWPEDEEFLPPRQEVKKLVRRRRTVPLYWKPEEVPGLSRILEDLRR